jgi:hypothetical protein
VIAYKVPFADGPWPQPSPSRMVPLGPEVFERLTRRLSMAKYACLAQLSIPGRVRALEAVHRRVADVRVLDEHGNLWLVCVDEGGMPWGVIAAAGVGLWFLGDLGGWCYAPDPVLDDDLCAELGIGLDDVDDD